jgi:hypothetical protein
MSSSALDDVKEALKVISLGQAKLLSAVETVSQRVAELEKKQEEDRQRQNGDAQSPPPTGVKSSFSSRVVLTTYPKQIGIKPIPLEWGAADPLQRGPVTVSRSPSTIGKRNAIGAHGGSYSIYYALAVASRELNADHRPDYTNTEPAVNIGPFPQWGDKKKIVAMDPWGHLVPWVFKDYIEKEGGKN